MTLFELSLREHREELDSLNVFPVPDGDTGTNLVATQERVERALAAGDGDADLAAMVGVIARASLLGARGNSGVILSIVLRGLCEELSATRPADGRAFSAGLRRASEEAWRAVSRPADGTILSVLRDGARAAERAAQGGAGLADVVELALGEARSSLVRTTDLLPELRAAGVVDAGAKGLVLLLDALRAAVRGGELSEPVGPAGPVGRARREPAGAPDRAFEVQVLVEAAEEAIPGMRRRLAEIGSSIVVVGGSGLFNVHVHTDEPALATEEIARAGRALEVRTADLREAVAACAGAPARGVRVVAGETCALLVVIEGEGLAPAFASFGGRVIGSVAGSPSAEELARALAAVPCPSVIVAADAARARAAAELAGPGEATAVGVVVARDAVAALAAATAFNPMSSLGENIDAMDDAASSCRSSMVTPGAGSDASLAVAAEADRLLSEAPEAEVLTLIAGAGVRDREADAVARVLRGAHPDLRVDVLTGGPAGSHYLVGVE